MYEDQTVAARVDARGLQCPMPLLKMKLALNQLAVGERLALLATDPGSMRDIAAFASIAGHQLLQAETVGDEFYYLLEKCA
ncbi:MAG: sulfurtransferase TusA family protein [Cellvibrionaceae bacterium]|nr:sulfurtransferase TusA family protein [Cellvibrionaceae bacterium]MCV6626339.1 sulfurtransferase TusA family protein [Cellvibrionaceae bacterium]